MLIHRVKVEVQVSAWQQWESTYEQIITQGEYIRTNTQSHMESTYEHSVTVGECIRTFSGRGEYIRTFHHNKGSKAVAGAPKASHIIITHKRTSAPFQLLC